MGCHCQNQDSVITVVWFFFHFLSTLNVSSRESEKLRHSSFHLVPSGIPHFLLLLFGNWVRSGMRGWDRVYIYIFERPYIFLFYSYKHCPATNIIWWLTPLPHSHTHQHKEKHGHRHIKWVMYTIHLLITQKKTWFGIFLLVINRFTFQHPHQKLILISYGLWVDFSIPLPLDPPTIYKRLKCKALCMFPISIKRLIITLDTLMSESGWLSDKKAFVHIVNVYIMFIFAVVSFISIHLNFRGNSSKIYKHLRHDTRTTSKAFILKDSYSLQNTSVLYR